MADNPPNPHDAYFRQVLGRSKEMAGELRAVMPPTMAAPHA
ncbi:hypothetical protein [Nocardia sp. CDC160]|nr:hypothetical protein [Nocardia sp. CDC160]MEC3917450.1 hypothetical protein [Nocardia sp. CDC160]